MPTIIVDKRLDMQHASIATMMCGPFTGIFVATRNIIIEHIHEDIRDANVIGSRSLSLSKAVAGEVKMSKPAPMFYYTSTKIIS